MQHNMGFQYGRWTVKRMVPIQRFLISMCTHSAFLPNLAQVVSTLEQEFVKLPGEEFREATLMSLVTRVYTRYTTAYKRMDV